MKEAKIDFEKGLVDLFIDGERVDTISAWKFDAEKARKNGWELDYDYVRY